jgi:hypothetical protein
MSTDPKLQPGLRLEKSFHLEEPGQGSAAIHAIRAQLDDSPGAQPFARAM